MYTYLDSFSFAKTISLYTYAITKQRYMHVHTSKIIRCYTHSTWRIIKATRRHHFDMDKGCIFYDWCCLSLNRAEANILASRYETNVCACMWVSSEHTKWYYDEFLLIFMLSCIRLTLNSTCLDHRILYYVVYISIAHKLHFFLSSLESPLNLRVWTPRRSTMLRCRTTPLAP